MGPFLTPNSLKATELLANGDTNQNAERRLHCYSFLVAWNLLVAGTLGFAHVVSALFR